MRPVDFLAHRVAFCGLPYGELEAALAWVRDGGSWEASFVDAARALSQLARARQGAGATSAVKTWLWAASAYQAASFGMHLDAEDDAWMGKVVRYRQLAEGSYQRALALDCELARPVRVPAAGRQLRGYLRRPRGEARAAVVLVNGLDSICEVELHRFGDELLGEGLAVLALALPDATAGAEPAGFRAEAVASAVADWLAAQPDLAGKPVGCFGVSFGGHLVARLLAGDRRFAAGVAVSPPAWLDSRPLGLRRVRRMFALALGVPEGPGLDELAAAITIDALPPPEGRLLLLGMERDELFGPEHTAAIRAWGSGGVELRSYAAEHVGTSRIHCWLPDACDWLRNQLAMEEGEERCAS